MTPDADIFEQIRLFLPKYLTPEESRELFSELSKFPDNLNFYLNRAELHDQLLQGDGWRGFIAIDFATGTRRPVSGLIMSNSCDISPENRRDLPVNVLFSPLLRLDAFMERLRTTGKTETQLETILVNIRKQRMTSMFYLPQHGDVIPESIVLLDNIHAHPLQDLLAQRPTKLFTLNQYAFYIFLIKLSIHFSRFQEGVRRFDGAA